MKPGRSISARIAFEVGVLHREMEGQVISTSKDRAAVEGLLDAERMSLLAGLLPHLSEHVEAGWIASFIGRGSEGLWLRIAPDGGHWSIFSGRRGSHYSSWVLQKEGRDVVSLTNWLRHDRYMEPDDWLKLIGSAALKALAPRA